MEPVVETLVNQPGAHTQETHNRLQILVAELLSDNQNLRFQVAQLEERARQAEKGLAQASQWCGTLL